jgi:hypothetical protein
MTQASGGVFDTAEGSARVEGLREQWLPRSQAERFALSFRRDEHNGFNRDLR